MPDMGDRGAPGRRGRHRGPKSHDADATVSLPRRALFSPDQEPGQAPDPWAPHVAGLVPEPMPYPSHDWSTAPAVADPRAGAPSSSSFYGQPFPGATELADDFPYTPYATSRPGAGAQDPFGADPSGVPAVDPFATYRATGGYAAAGEPFDDSLTSFALSPAFHSPQPVALPPVPRATPPPTRRRKPWLWIIAAAVLVLVVVLVLATSGRGTTASPTVPANPATSPVRVGGVPFTSGTVSGYWRITQQKWEGTGVVVTLEVTIDSGNLNYTFHAIGMNESTTIQPDPASTIDSPGFVSAGTTLTGTLEFTTARQPLMLVMANEDGSQLSALQVTA